MKALLLALILATAPAQAGKGRKATERAIAAATEHQVQALQALQTGALDQALAEVDQAVAAHPAPPVELFLLRTTIRMNLDDLPGAAGDLRLAMGTPLRDEEVGMATVAVTDLGTSLALGLATAGADPEQPLPDERVDAALALLDDLDAFLGRSVADPRLRAIAARTRVALLQVAWARGEELLAAFEDLDAAQAVVDRVLVLLPEEPGAHALAASLLATRAARLMQESNQVGDLEQGAALFAQAQALVAQARPHLEVVVAADPDDREAVRQLLQIALMADDAPAAARWRAELDRLGGG